MKYLIILILFGTTVSFAQEWKDVPLPDNLRNGAKWVLQEDISDEFNYNAPASNKGEKFFQKWTDFYHNQWTGPGLTIWDRGHIDVADSRLQIRVSRLNPNKINTGCITSKKRVQYPVYVEARAKVPNSVLACAVWLLSPDDTQEIDILEAYGSSFSENAQKDQTWFAERIHVSHHVFIRNPFQDYQPTDAGSWYRDGTLWREKYHTYGVYWRDPLHLEYYIDGKLVRTVSGMNIIDPKGYTNGTGLNKEMDIIINVEDQNWRSNQNITPTNNELLDKEGHTFNVDWIRVYKPEIALGTEENGPRTGQIKVFPNPTQNRIQFEAGQEIDSVSLLTWAGQKISHKKINARTGEIEISGTNSKSYLLILKMVSGEQEVRKVYIQ